eukprot:TRINITY_DN70297_c0_g1_i1.p1 TRINITY_DN70297_c0_g1~~TRINITY_DN70297_c0_g1_i1.p1  ORF type:complete len:378 (-),score=67.72 TRINITY_DN70297_c0_g1_i1:86-1177(-)
MATYAAQYGGNVLADGRLMGGVQADGQFLSRGEGRSAAQYQGDVQFAKVIETPYSGGRFQSGGLQSAVPYVQQLPSSRVTSFQTNTFQASTFQPSIRTSLQPTSQWSSSPMGISQARPPFAANSAVPAQMAAYSTQGGLGAQVVPSAPAAAVDLDSVAQQVRSAIVPQGGDEHVVVCILGGTTFQSEANRLIVIDLARALSAAGMRAVFVTGGNAGVQQTFAQAFGEANGASQIFHLLPHGQESGFGVGHDVHAGANADERKKIMGLVGDVYVTIEGGPGVASEARDAVARGASVVPLIRSGGASAGMFDFPMAAMNPPQFVNQDQWALLSQEVQPTLSANAMAHIVRVCAASILLAGGGVRS